MFKKNCRLYTVLTATDLKPQNHTNIYIQAMLVWLALLFVIFAIRRR